MTSDSEESQSGNLKVKVGSGTPGMSSRRAERNERRRDDQPEEERTPHYLSLYNWLPSRLGFEMATSLGGAGGTRHVALKG